MSSKDMEISAMSYTNKDFASIYPEILDLAKQLTNRWDPSQSNESDPGVVLLKEAAFVADHNNYNIDKNILENFLPSATQEKSVRNITEMNGYTPRYYVAATGDVTFKWQNTTATSDQSFHVAPFTFVITDEDKTIFYTQAEELAITIDELNPTKASPTIKCKFIEGTLQTMQINNSTTITLDSLDDNNRIYLPETRVAQNGVYIKNVNSADYADYWKRDNFLLTKPVDSRSYKLDFDSDKNLPYIEFPSDIANLIGEGLYIQYIATSGASGNVSANKLVNISSPSTFTDREGNERSSEYFTLTNSASIQNGKDPETLTEMYKSFKKTVGTFETLVSCLDYKNAVYNLKDDYDDPIISNCYVTDRRSDYNKALNVVTFDDYGAYFKNISIEQCALNFKGKVATIDELKALTGAATGDIYFVEADLENLYINVGGEGSLAVWQACKTINLNDFALLTEAMTPFDITIYALKLYAASDYTSKAPYKALAASFKPIDSSTRHDIQGSASTDGYLEEDKCICHQYKDPLTNDVYCFKNYAPLRVTIAPFNKVTSTERASILNNVYMAISEKFNPREIEFGEGLDREDLKTCIKEADSRIKDCDIEFSYLTRAMLASGDEYVLQDKNETTSKKLFIELIAKNILAGRICLFNFDTDFSYEFDQSMCSVEDKVTNIKTEVPIYVKKGSTKATSTTEQAGEESIITSTGDQYLYLLHAPNWTEKDATGKTKWKDVQSGLKYELKYQYNEVTKKYDTDFFEIDALDSSGNISTTARFTASNDVKYVIEFVGDENLKNKEITHIPSGTRTDYYLPTGTLTITEYKITASSNAGSTNLDYKLNKNEYLQVIQPNYYSDETFSIYVNYRFTSTASHIINANCDYTLKSGDKLIMIYTNDGVTSQKILEPGTIVRSSFDIVPTDTLSSSGVRKSWTDTNGVYHDNEQFRTLASNQTISTRILLETELSDPTISCYWIVTPSVDGSYRMFEGSQMERILNTNEYFIYTNATRDELMILGAGTKIVRTDTNDDQWRIAKDDIISISAITEDGTAASIAWQTLDFSKFPTYVTEMSVVTLGEDDEVIIAGWTNMINHSTTPGQELYYIDNNWQDCNGSITYTMDGETVILPSVENTYRIRSRLDVISNDTNAQRLFYKLSETSEGTKEVVSMQSITVTSSSGTTTYKPAVDDGTGEITYHNIKFYSSQELNLIGGDSIDLSVYSDNNIEINMYFFVDDEVHTIRQLFDGVSESYKSTDMDSNYRTINVDFDESLSETTQTFEYIYPFWYMNNKTKRPREYMIPIYINGNQTDVQVGIYKDITKDGSGRYVVNSPVDIEDYNYSESYASSLTLKGNSLYFIYIDPSLEDSCQLYLRLKYSITNSKKKMPDYQVIIIDDIRVIRCINERISIKINNGDITKVELLDKMKTLITKSDTPSTKFYYSYIPDSSIALNLGKYEVYTVDTNGNKTYTQYVFDNPESFYDTNNVANMMTIAEVDLANSDIDIDNSMLY